VNCSSLVNERSGEVVVDENEDSATYNFKDCLFLDFVELVLANEDDVWPSNGSSVRIPSQVINLDGAVDPNFLGEFVRPRPKWVERPEKSLTSSIVSVRVIGEILLLYCIRFNRFYYGELSNAP
jgi:hypothetical protein